MLLPFRKGPPPATTLLAATGVCVYTEKCFEATFELYILLLNVKWNARLNGLSADRLIVINGLELIQGFSFSKYRLVA